MISFDERSGGSGSVNLNPIYSSLQMLSIVKLDSSIFNNFTSTLTISGGSPYQIPFDDIPSDAESFCLYNITGDVSNKSLTQTLALSALNSFNNNTLNGSFFDINAKSISLTFVFGISLYPFFEGENIFVLDFTLQ
jgi:hypothetical protein